MKATASDSNTIVDDAVGAVTHGDGRVLLAKRPQGKPPAGHRELPGGRFESNESPGEAPGRELHEVPGVELDAADPWITRIHRDPHIGTETALPRHRGRQDFDPDAGIAVPPATLLK